MARKSKAQSKQIPVIKHKGSASNLKNVLKTADSKKSKSLLEIGVAPLDFQISSKSGSKTKEEMRDIEMFDISHDARRFAFVSEENRTEIGSGSQSWADEVETLDAGATTQSGMSKTRWSTIVNPQSVHNTQSVMHNDLVHNTQFESNLVKINFEDTQSEIEYREHALVAYVLGSNPLLNAMEGYFKRIWGK